MRKLVAATALMMLSAKGAHAETYRLIHALGNSEKEIARDLTKRDCEARKREHIAVSEKLGTYNAKTGSGSITCLPSSFFLD